MGYTLAGVGAAAVGVGIPLTAAGGRLERSLGAGTPTPSVDLLLSPSGFALTIQIP